MQSTEAGRDLYQRMEASPKQLTILEAGDGQQTSAIPTDKTGASTPGVGSDTIMPFNPNGAPAVPTEAGMEYSTPGEVLYHETSHGLQNAEGGRDESPSSENSGRSKEEVRAIKDENRMREETGRPQREI